MFNPDIVFFCVPNALVAVNVKSSIAYKPSFPETLSSVHLIHKVPPLFHAKLVLPEMLPLLAGKLPSTEFDAVEAVSISGKFNPVNGVHVPVVKLVASKL